MVWTREQMIENLNIARTKVPGYGKRKHPKPDPLNPKKGGRPRKVYSEEELEANSLIRIEKEIRDVEKLAELQVGDRDISIYIEMPLDYVQETYRETIDRAQLIGKIKLISAQFENALNGNSNMQMWLGKHCLGQKEGAETSSIQAEFREFIHNVRKVGDALSDTKSNIQRVDIIPKHNPISK
jgi:hypothetical protein